MAASGHARLLCWTVLLLCLYDTVLGGEQALDCCLRVGGKKIPLNRLVSYQVQDRTQGCKIDAVIFTTVIGCRLCAPSDAHWVKKRMAKLDAKPRTDQENNFMGNGCKRTK